MMHRATVMALLLAAMGSAPTSAQDLFASIRPDAWLKEFMVEKQPAPKDGRRVHVVAAFNGTGIDDSDLRSVTINGAECLGLPSDDKADLSVYDWCRVHVGDSHLWISYHTRNSQFAEGRKLAVKAIASSGALVDGTIEANFSPLVLSHVTTTEAGRKAVIHVHSASQEPVAVLGLQFDGAEVPSASSHVVVPPNGHALYVVDLLQPKAHGDVWTAVLHTDHPDSPGGGVGWGGRVGPERFPIETWPHSSDCVVPQPNASSQNATEVRELGIDSVFEGFGRFKDNCDITHDGTAKTYSRVLDSLAAEGYWHVFLDGENSDQWDKNAMISPQTRAKVVDAILTGDEVQPGTKFIPTHAVVCPRLIEPLSVLVATFTKLLVSAGRWWTNSSAPAQVTEPLTGEYSPHPRSDDIPRRRDERFHRCICWHHRYPGLRCMCAILCACVGLALLALSLSCVVHAIHVVR